MLNKENLFELQISDFTIESKPTVFDKRSQSWSCYIQGLATVDRMAELIGQGRIWRNGVYDQNEKSFKKKHALGSRFIVLDFDECEFAPGDIIDNAIYEGISPNMWYYSFSQGIKGGSNFRVVWILDQVIDSVQFSATMKVFLEKFSLFNPDRQTKDVSRLWYPGKHGVQVVSKKLHDWSSWEINITEEKKLIEKGLNLDLKYTPNVKISVIEWEKELDKNCILWDKFKGGYYLHYGERVLLFGNLRLLDGAYERVLELLEEFEEIYYDSSFNESQLRYIWEDDALEPFRIIKKNKKNLNVIELFENRMF